MRTSRVIAATGLGLALALAGGATASAAALPAPLSAPMAQAACQVGGGTPDAGRLRAVRPGPGLPRRLASRGCPRPAGRALTATGPAASARGAGTGLPVPR